MLDWIKAAAKRLLSGSGTAPPTMAAHPEHVRGKGQPPKRARPAPKRRPPKKRRLFSELQRTEMAAAYLDGKTLAAVATQFLCSEWVARRVITQEGVSIRPGVGKSPEEREERRLFSEDYDNFGLVVACERDRARRAARIAATAGGRP